ncbi:tRNA (guanosine(46)-N7)-methyltransferase TrmB [Polymorphobacter fuscus]|uniref:tRNA (guanine-N(7)-)-methyltransferase n=1 Tax=Sandarakinorhabdus fusca TaxID=1439888 RepID=A0A7C9KHS2_9SPHN|nr:tRNA (guanosine(46)-N7)-methyltransferase TrmB [Polymorphobacter fuscus]KAB7648026.1 tRNA (guanosine(46)-N7)-methyltransferase TrmB [Polymorphobacter fuscus]MQT17120.1 tRNA (guanosine(46)-N7)-methyltransferase TrmB [Polymorphobacter fuscus]NJC08888.1 tRNA (guanine-N7-)-methyltransferase [Polymorphobacter fuscus]
MTAVSPPDPASIRRLYGRRTGHKLRVGQAALVEHRLPEVSVPTEGGLDSQRLFGDDRPLWLEIGFGRGEHMAAQAAANPQVGIIGAEPFLDGVVGALLEIEARSLPNIRLHNGDALDVIDRLPDASLDKVFLLHPDPWPKFRHAKRRFVNPGPLALVARVLKPGGEFRIGTDHPVYCRWALAQMQQSPDFDWQVEAPTDWQQRADDWPQTRYEIKARAHGHEVWYFRYRRRTPA